ncbi:MAG: integrase core domain-containing protein [Bryobacteraceae bacterium]
MSRKANPYDNATCESFMKTLKYEEVHRQEYRDLAEARASVGVFLEKVYNQKRLHSAVGYRPPVEFEQSLAGAAGARASPSVGHTARPGAGKAGRARARVRRRIVGVTMAAGKLRASRPENGLDLSRGRALRQPRASDPKIHDTPVRLRKSSGDVPSPHAGLVEPGRSRA